MTGKEFTNKLNKLYQEDLSNLERRKREIDLEIEFGLFGRHNVTEE
jgi:hypothetical protein